MAIDAGRPRVGVVLIGRNEGERLVRALDSVLSRNEGEGRPVVYVDSASTDDSVGNARARGAIVVDLDMSIPFSAARARNAGWEALLAAHPELDFVQFIDGDCEVVPGFIEAAVATLDAHTDVVAVCGYRRERFPEASPYNAVCEVEWTQGAVGEIDAFTGDVMIRAEALTRTRGYDPRVIAGEEAEFAYRLRRETHGRIVRLDRDMTLHDADMHEFRQWWRRAVRTGHGYAQVDWMQRDTNERAYHTNMKRSLVWGAVAPASAVAMALPTLGLSLGILGRYPVTAVRVAMKTRRMGYSWTEALAWGGSCALAAFPETVGVVRFHRDRLSGRAPKIIEYKQADDNDA